MNIYGIVRRFSALTGSHQLRLDELGNVAVSQVLPKYAQLCKAGKLYCVSTHASTAKAISLTAPVLAPEWALYNGNSEGGPSLVLIQVACWLESGVSGLGLAMFVGVTTGMQTTVPTDYSTGGAVVKTNLNGGPFNSNAILANNPTLVGGTPSYVVVANHGNDLAINGVGNGLVADVEGMFIARPGYMICMEVVGADGSSELYNMDFVYAEVQLDIE